jgi:DNA replication and repair protein RecF
MRVSAVALRDFRSYGNARAVLGDALTVVSGPNGAGKTNLLEAMYFGCTGRSCRTTNEREVVRFGAPAARVLVSADNADGTHELAVGFVPGQPKRMTVDGAPVERLLDVAERPLVSVFLPDRLELIKGAPTLRRAHLDQFVSALWPAHVATRRGYAQALAQRNALIARIRSGHGSRAALHTWDRQLAGYGIALMADRAAAAGRIAPVFARLGADLGLEGDATLAYRPRSTAATAEQLSAELAERIDGDFERGFTEHGPHRDDLVTTRDGRELRTYGSQGEQRLALLALLLAERSAIADERRTPPLMLLDDVMSELDRARRQALVDVLLQGGGQAIISTTDLEHVPGADRADVARIAVASGRLIQEAIAA